MVLENDLLRAVVLADKGADIYELVYKPADLDVLFKTPWGFHDLGSLGATASDSQVAWIDHYGGGWNEIFPNFGSACEYEGLEWSFHGEVSTAGWSYRILENSSGRASVRFEVDLTRTPFHLERTMTVEAGRPDLLVQERLTNTGKVEMPYMWGSTIRLSAPRFSDRNAGLTCPASTYRVMIPQTTPERTWMPAEGEWTWPHVAGLDGQSHDMRRIPGPESKLNTLGFADDLDEGWYGLTNQKLGIGVGFVWPKEVFPYLWIWQELNSTPGYPWLWEGVRDRPGVPQQRPPGDGLLKAMEAGTERRIGAGESLDVEFRCVLYQSTGGVERITPGGTVVVRS